MTARIGPGARVGPYEIVGWLGAGGMGEVYRARDARLGRDVAVKLIAKNLATDAGRVRRFEQEARAAGQLNHPNILAVYDAGVYEGLPYIVSELLEGESLRARLRGGAIAPRKAADYARQVAEGLAAAHERGIVHRDVKPDNLFITNDGRVKILDFGVAKLTLSDAAAPGTGMPTDTAAGTVVGTAAYMSPEQVRGAIVDTRSDIFSVGSVLFEMLSGRPAFARDTAAETMTAILNAEAADLPPSGIPPALARIVSRCMEKAREARFQSARDLAFGLEFLAGTTGIASAPPLEKRRRALTALGIVMLILTAAAAVASWLRNTTQQVPDNPLAMAKFSALTDFEGSEIDAAISPDGRFVVFLSDHDGPFHVWLKQVGAGPRNLTPGQGDQRNAGPTRSVGFSGDGGEIWINGTSGRRLALMPLMGGASRAFLADHAVNVAFSADGARLVYFTYDSGDPLFVADSTGGNPRQIFVGDKGDHNHFPAWSLDGEWIYFAHGNKSVSRYDIWRIHSSGGPPEPLTHQNADIRYLTPIDTHTLLYVAPDEDRSGPWLWALDLLTRRTRRVSIGLEQYLSIAASADRRRLVATVANSTADLWSVPIRDAPAVESDVRLYPVPTTRSLAPRFGGGSLFYVSSSGSGDGLWRLRDGRADEVWKGSDEPVIEAPGVSARGDKVAIVVRRKGTSRLVVVSADGADHTSLADGLDVYGAPSWSPDGKWIVTAGSDAQGVGLFKIPADGGSPVRLTTGAATDPVWSPADDIIVYLGEEIATAPLLGVREDGRPISLPNIRIPTGGRGRARFLPDGKGLVYLQGSNGAQDFWLLDIPTQRTRRLTQLTNAAVTSTFDIAQDGTHIVFDRLHERSDIVLIELPAPGTAAPGAASR